jgi:hypothetical protein
MIGAAGLPENRQAMVGSTPAMSRKRQGAVFEGRKHDALADARGVAAGFIALIGKGGPNPFLPE